MKNIKVKDLSATTSINSSNQLMILTNESNNIVQNITVENFNENIISTDSNNGITQGTDGNLYVDDSDSGVTAGTYQYPQNLVVDSKGKIISLEQGQEANVPIATLSTAGIVKPDGQTIKVDLDGTINVDVDEIETELNGKADTDLSNVTSGAFEHVLNTVQQSGKETIIGWGMPDYTAGVSISAAPYVCPCNGIIVSPYNITINGSQIFAFFDYGGYNTPNSMTAPVCKGDIINGNIANLKFYPLKGEN